MPIVHFQRSGVKWHFENLKSLSEDLPRNANFSFLEGGRPKWHLCQVAATWHFLALTFGTRSAQVASQWSLGETDKELKLPLFIDKPATYLLQG